MPIFYPPPQPIAPGSGNVNDKLIQSGTSQAASDPPFDARARTHVRIATDAWQPGPPQPQRSPQWVPQPYRPDAPPPYSHVALDTIHSAWERGPDLPNLGTNIAAVIPIAAAADNPPPNDNNATAQRIVIESWAPYALPILPPRQPIAALAERVDAPPLNGEAQETEDATVAAWWAPYALPTLLRRVPIVSAVQADAPPPSSTVNAELAVRSWQPVPYARPQVGPKAVQPVPPDFIASGLGYAAAANPVEDPGAPHIFTMADGFRVALWMRRIPPGTGDSQRRVYYAIRDPNALSWGDPVQADNTIAQAFITARAGDNLFALAYDYISNPARIYLHKFAYAGGLITHTVVTVQTGPTSAYVSDYTGLYYDAANDLIHTWSNVNDLGTNRISLLQAWSPADLSFQYSGTLDPSKPIGGLELELECTLLGDGGATFFAVDADPLDGTGLLHSRRVVASGIGYTITTEAGLPLLGTGIDAVDGIWDGAALVIIAMSNTAKTHSFALRTGIDTYSSFVTIVTVQDASQGNGYEPSVSRRRGSGNLALLFTDHGVGDVNRNIYQSLRLAGAWQPATRLTDDSVEFSAKSAATDDTNEIAGLIRYVYVLHNTELRESRTTIPDAPMPTSSARGLAIVGLAWTDVRLPQQRPPFVVQGVVTTADAPPPSSAVNDQTIAGWWTPGPLLPQRTLPIAHIAERVDPPIPSASSDVTLGIIGRAWEPVPALPQAGPQLVPITAVSADAPTPTSGVNEQIVGAAWQPGPPLPQRSGPVAHFAERVDQPTPDARALVTLGIIGASWIPGPPASQRAPSWTAQPYTPDLPPPSSGVNEQTTAGWWIPGPPLPQRTPPIAHVAERVDAPPIRRFASELSVAAWPRDYLLPALNEKSAASAEPVNAPQPNTSRVTPSIVDAWQPAPTHYTIQQYRKYVQPSTYVPDNPPFDRRNAQNIATLARLWWGEPVGPLPSVAPKQVQPYLPDTPIPSHDRTNLATVVSAWQPPTPRAEQYPKTQGERVDAPIPDARALVINASIVSGWQPPVARAEQYAKTPPAFVPDNPPFATHEVQQFATIRASWEPAPPQPQRSPSWTAQPYRPDSPTPNATSSVVLRTIAAAWEPGPPLPTLGPRTAAAIPARVDDPTPNANADVISSTIVASWQPGPPAPQRGPQWTPQPYVPDAPRPNARELVVLGTITTAWQSSWNAQSAPRSVLPGWSVDQPRPSAIARVVQRVIRSAWEPGPPLPTLGAHIATTAPVPPAATPSGTMLRTVSQHPIENPSHLHEQPGVIGGTMRRLRRRP